MTLGLFFSLFFEGPSPIFGQNFHFEVVYEESINYPLGPVHKEMILLLNREKSVYYLSKVLAIGVRPGVKVDTLPGADTKGLPSIQKDFSGKEILYTDRLADNRTRKTIAERLPLQQWTLQPEIKQVGRYLCKKAVASFRGREYVAWYTEEIPSIGGPWKFDGLGGLILEVASLDGFFSIKARSVARRDSPLTAPTGLMPLKKEEAVSWDAFCKLYQDGWEKKRKYLASKMEPGDELSFSWTTIEDFGVKGVRVIRN